MRIVIIGQKWLAAELLRQCMNAGHQVLAVVAPSPAAESDPDRLVDEAQRARVPVLHVQGRLSSSGVPPCDLILAAHAHCFIDSSARAQAKLGALGYHPSLLPRHRGRDAIHWALHMREPITGGSLYWMDDGADTGPVVAQAYCHIRPDDTAATLWRRELAPIGLRLFADTLAQLSAGTPCQGQPQAPELATWEPAWSPKKLSA